VSDEAISAENKDCFAPHAMTFRLNFTALPLRREGQGEGDKMRLSPPLASSLPPGERGETGPFPYNI